MIPKSVLIVGRVLLDEVLLILRHIVEGMDRIGGAGGNTSATINTALRVHIHLSRRFKAGLVLLGVYAIGGTDLDAERILDASVTKHAGHDEFNLQNEMNTASSLSASVRNAPGAGRDFDHLRMCASKARAGDKNSRVRTNPRVWFEHDEDHAQL